MSSLPPPTVDLPYTLEFMLQHPQTCPGKGFTMGPYLIDAPGPLGSTAAWKRFRDQTLLPMREFRPADRYLAEFVHVIERVLMWRERIPPDKRFWKADQVGLPDGSPVGGNHENVQPG